jgi:hypothetical protein
MLGLLAILGIGAVSIYRQQQRSRLDLEPQDQTHARLYDCVDADPLPAADLRTFVDATDSVQLNFTHAVGPPGTYYTPESVGSGGAFCDFDNDGLLDLFLVNSGRSPDALGEFAEGVQEESRLYRMSADGRFIDVSAGSGVERVGYGMGCAVGDVDNDGDADLYVTTVGQDRLFLNQGDMRFTDITAAAGFEKLEWGTGASFLDYDRDGLLDLVVVNYARDDTYEFSVACGIKAGRVSYCGPQRFQQTVDRLYHNDGIQQRPDGSSVPQFSDVTESSGLSGVTTYGFAAVCADFTGDGWVDIYIANDARPNRLWVNQTNGKFIDEAAARGVSVNGDGSAEGSMGIAVGDLDRNLALDLVVTHLSGESTTLYLNDGSGHFIDQTEAAGLLRPTFRHTGWGGALVDLDHDGDLDLPLVNGLVIPCHSGFPPHGDDRFQVHRERIEDATSFWRDYYDANLLMVSEEETTFRDRTIQQGGDFTRALGSGRSLIYGDPDRDGDLDLVVTNSGGRTRYYRNDFKKSGHWLRVRLLDPRWRRDALGASVRVEAGGETWMGAVVPASSYLASNDVRVHFGIGLMTKIDRVLVHWPDGPVDTCIEEFSGMEIDSDAILERGQGRIVKEPQ